MKILKLTILIILSVYISCKTNDYKSGQIAYNDNLIKLHEKEIEKLLNNSIQFEKLKILFPNSIDTVYKKDGKPIEVYYKEDRKWMDSIRNLNISNVQFVDSYRYSNNKSIYSVVFNGLFESEYLYKIRFKGKYLIETKIAKDSLINNIIDSVSCEFLTKRYFENGQLKGVGATTDYNNQFEGVPVGLHSQYDSLGRLNRTIFYHISTMDKAYKIITDFNDKGEITSKIKTKNDYLDEILPDTLEVLVPQKNR